MNTEEFKAITKSVQELAKTRVAMAGSVKSIKTDIAETKKLWKSENKPWLIRTGAALMVMPDPLVTCIIGSGFLAAGAVQEGIKRQAVYLDDLPKAFNSAMRTLRNSKDLL